jgi:hypothetical protein
VGGEAMVSVGEVFVVAGRGVEGRGNVGVSGDESLEFGEVWMNRETLSMVRV